MKILSYDVQMTGKSQKTSATKTQINKLGIISTKNFLDENGIGRKGETLENSALVDLTEKAKKLQQDLQNGDFSSQGGTSAKDMLKNMIDEQLSKTEQISKSLKGKTSTGTKDYRVSLLERMIEVLTGKKIRVADEIKIDLSGRLNPSSLASRTSGNSGEQPPQASNGATVQQLAMLNITTLSIEHYESENVSFNAKANISTEDGRQINIDMALNMSRELYQKFEFQSVQAGVFVDPLVINFGADMASLTDQKITFDLDCDGESDQISTLAGGSGFLALDKNGDGSINDGNELFGAKNGDGFADLAQYDQDGNGWIDENDEIWDKLRVWTHDEKGNSSLLALGEVGLGAIYLGNVNTEFSLTGEDPGNVNGLLRKTGFFLREDGSAGTVQHIDLKI